VSATGMSVPEARTTVAQVGDGSDHGASGESVSGAFSGKERAGAPRALARSAPQTTAGVPANVTADGHTPGDTDHEHSSPERDTPAPKWRRLSDDALFVKRLNILLAFTEEL
jgi:hypothetical protein